MGNYWVLSIPGLLSLVHYLGLHSHKIIKKQKEIIRSFAAGFSVAYVFLLLIPEIPRLSLEVELDLALLVLVGFVGFHMAHKYVLDSKLRWRQKKLLMDEIHLLTNALYSFLLTFSMVEISLEFSLKGFLLSSVIVLHIGLIELARRKPEGKVARLELPVLVLATILGGLFPLRGWISNLVKNVMFALTAGAIVYTAIREEVPNDSEGKPRWFLFGATLLSVGMKLLI